MSGTAARGGILREKVGSVPVGDELTRVGIWGKAWTVSVGAGAELTRVGY